MGKRFHGHAGCIAGALHDLLTNIALYLPPREKRREFFQLFRPLTLSASPIIYFDYRDIQLLQPAP